MQRVPLSTPAHAAALVAVGFPRTGVKMDPLHHTGTGEQRMGWFFEGGNAEDAADLLRRRRPDIPQALWREDRTHPFLAALAGVANMEVLEAWRESPHDLPHGVLAHGGKLLLLKAPGRKSDGVQPAPIDAVALAKGFVFVRDIDAAAALVTVGFCPAPRLGADGAFLIQERSFIYPHLTGAQAREACRLMRDPLKLAPQTLEDFKPGQHPLQFAFAAAGNYLSVPESERQAWRHATHFIKGKKCALFNAEAMQNPKLEEAIMRHVAGV